MPTPLVSILMPVHNGFPYLPETMESLLKQTFTDFELIAIDDGSTDETTDYLKHLSDHRVKYLRTEKVRLVTALNEGTKIAQAEFLARIDADDVATPDRLAKQVAFMQAHPKCVLLGCDFDEIDSQGKFISDNVYKMTSDAALKFQLFFCTPFLHPGVMMRKSALLAVGGYRKVYDVAEDFDLWTRLTTQGELASLPDRLMHKRIHGNAISVVHRDKGLSQSSEIAANYAKAVSKTLDPNAASELYWFFQIGQAPEYCSLQKLVDQFQKTLALFPNWQQDADLRSAVEYTRQRLRWFAADHAKKSLATPWNAWSWFRSMAGFDPEHGSFSSIIRRRFRKSSSEDSVPSTSG